MHSVETALGIGVLQCAVLRSRLMLDSGKELPRPAGLALALRSKQHELYLYRVPKLG